MYGAGEGDGGSVDTTGVTAALQATRNAASWEVFAEHLAVGQDLRPETIRCYARYVREWHHYAQVRRLDVLDPPLTELGRYVNTWKVLGDDGGKVAPSAAVRLNRRKALASYGRYLRRLGLVRGGYPTSQIRVQPDKEHRKASLRTLRPDELHALVTVARSMTWGHYILVRLLCDLGPRAHELVGLVRRSWAPSNDPPRLRVGGQGRGTMADREVSPSTAEDIAEYLRWLDAVLPSVDRRPGAPLLLVPARRFDVPVPLTERRIERIVARVVRRAGIDPVGVRPHALRATWIRHGLSAFPLSEVSAGIGHASVTSTLRYAPAGTVPSSAHAFRVREAVAGSVAQGVLLVRALDGGEPQPVLRHLMAGREEVARLRSDVALLQQVEALRAEKDALERQVTALRAGVVAA